MQRPIFAVDDPFPIRYMQGRRFSHFKFSWFGVTANFSYAANVSAFTAHSKRVGFNRCRTFSNEVQ